MAINDRTQYEEDQNEKDTRYNPSDAIACLGKALKRLDKMSRPNFTDIPSDICKNFGFQHNIKCEDVTANRVTALTVSCSAEDESSDEEMTDEELAETYKLMYTKWKELCIVCEKQKKVINTLTQENTDM